MKKVSRYVELDEPEYEMTDGQLSDYMAAMETGDTSEWDYGIVEYQCRSCKTQIGEIGTWGWTKTRQAGGQ